MVANQFQIIVKVVRKKNNFVISFSFIAYRWNHSRPLGIFGAYFNYGLPCFYTSRRKPLLNPIIARPPKNIWWHVAILHANEVNNGINRRTLGYSQEAPPPPPLTAWDRKRALATVMSMFDSRFEGIGADWPYAHDMTTLSPEAGIPSRDK